MRARHLGENLQVSALGLGCMGMSTAYGGQAEADAIRTLHHAVDIGVTFIDTAEVYGPYDNETLIGKAFKDRRGEVIIATKFGFTISEHGEGMARMVGVDGSPKRVKAAAEGSLKRLGIETIDLFYQHRVDPNVPIEETVGAMADLVRDGKVRFLGLSEAGAATIRRAHAVHPIAAVQSEYSLWTRDHEADVIPTCEDLGIGFVPYSPLGRGFLTGAIRDRASLSAGDYRLTSPRFEDRAFAANLALVDTLTRLADAKGATAAQLALAWVMHQGDTIVPIPGARKIKHLDENAAASDIVLSPADLAEIEAAIPHDKVVGPRYHEAGMAMVGR